MIYKKKCYSKILEAAEDEYLSILKGKFDRTHIDWKWWYQGLGGKLNVRRTLVGSVNYLVSEQQYVLSELVISD